MPLSTTDLLSWCKHLGILLKGVFVRNEPMPFNHSPCIINLDDFGKLETHWVCCWCNADEFEYFDSFGLPNNCQIQWIGGECCRWYCLPFLNKPYEGRVFSQVLDLFTADTERALHCLSVCRETGRWQRNSRKCNGAMRPCNQKRPFISQKKGRTMPETFRNPVLQKKAINLGLKKAMPVVEKLGSRLLDQLSSKVWPNPWYIINHKDLDRFDGPAGELARHKPRRVDKIAEAVSMFL